MAKLLASSEVAKKALSNEAKGILLFPSVKKAGFMSAANTAKERFG